MPNQNQNQKQKMGTQDLEREAAQRPDYDRSDQSMHRQEIEKEVLGGQKGRGQKSDAGRRDTK